MLQVQEVEKRFGDRKVVRGVSFNVQKGESFGLLGPNGAGKSTIISTICGLLPYDSGDVKVGALSVKESPKQVKQQIGVVPQDIALYPTMSAQDNLIFWGKMYGLGRALSKRRAAEVLAIVGLTDRAKDKVESYSGGMKRRINIGAALMHRPELLIMDEPTVGIDPQSRNHILETVKELNKAGMTIIYTSHYMEEVEYLCDRIAIIDHGQLIASGTKTQLCNRLAGGSAIQLKVDSVTAGLLEQLQLLPLVEQVTAEQENITIYSADSRDCLAGVVSCTAASGSKIVSLDVQEPNLETVFLQLTGRTLRD